MGAQAIAAKDQTAMKRIAASLADVREIRPRVFEDARGFFLETYHQEKFVNIGITENFVQDNYSCSTRGTLRGLHYQLHHPQAKLCSVVEGEALDVVVDIRLGSPDFGKWTSVLLSAKEHNQIYVPAGFAHGFLARSERVHFLYKCSDFYDPSDEYGISWNDSDLNIAWGIAAPFISEKDARYPSLASAPREFLPIYPSQ